MAVSRKASGTNARIGECRIECTRFTRSDQGTTSPSTSASCRDPGQLRRARAGDLVVDRRRRPPAGDRARAEHALDNLTEDGLVDSLRLRRHHAHPDPPHTPD